MDYIDHQRVPDDVYALNKTLLWTANHHFPYFAPNGVVQAMIRHCEENFQQAAEMGRRDQMLRLSRRIKELEPHTSKPPVENTARGEIQRYDMIQHFRCCMENLLAHFALTEVWNQSQNNPWEDRLRMKAALYLESNTGTMRAGEVFCEFNSHYEIDIRVWNGYQQTHDAAVELLREMSPHWQTID